MSGKKLNRVIVTSIKFREMFKSGCVDRDSSVGMTIRYGLDGRGSNPVQTGPGTHPGFCTMGTGPFLGVK
jgi:hypothetical protein